MKKLLLSTSAIVGVGLIASPSMAADRIKLNVGGYMEQYIGYASADYATGARSLTKFDEQSDTEVYFSGSTKLDNGITFAATVELESDETSASSSQIDESYMRVISPTLGELRLGADDSADVIMVVQPARGISADYDNWVVETGLSKNDNLYDGSAGDTNKITYFSPKIAGFQVGASYSPSANNNSVDPADYLSATTVQGSVIAFAGTYETKINDVGIEAGVGYSKRSHGINSNNGAISHSNINGGLNLSYMGWTVGAGYARTRQDAILGTVSTVDGHRYQASIQYKTGPYTVGIWHMKDTNRGTADTSGNDVTKVTTGYGEYQLSDGVKLQGLVFNVDYDNEEGKGTNTTGGWGVVTGFRLDF